MQIGVLFDTHPRVYIYIYSYILNVHLLIHAWHHFSGSSISGLRLGARRLMCFCLCDLYTPNPITNNLIIISSVMPSLNPPNPGPLRHTLRVHIIIGRRIIVFDILSTLGPTTLCFHYIEPMCAVQSTILYIPSRVQH